MYSVDVKYVSCINDLSKANLKKKKKMTKKNETDSQIRVFCHGPAHQVKHD